MIERSIFSIFSIFIVLGAIAPVALVISSPLAEGWSGLWQAVESYRELRLIDNLDFMGIV